jgi:hypothetical protein
VVTGDERVKVYSVIYQANGMHDCALEKLSEPLRLKSMIIVRGKCGGAKKNLLFFEQRIKFLD